MAYKSLLKAQSFILAVAISFFLISSFNERASNTSANDRVTMAVSAPVITGVEINGKVLTVSGQNFGSGAKVLINGKEQKTKFNSPTRLTAKKSGKKLKAGDNLQVRNPDGTTSPELLYFKEPYEVPVEANDIVYSASTDRLYASVGNQAKRYANSIAIINPRTTQVEATIPVGKQPRQLALSDDAHFLYVIIEDGIKVQRVNLSAARMDLEIDLPASLGFNECQFASSSVRVMPSHPQTIAVSFYCSQTTYPIIAILDNGIRRPAMATGPFYASLLAFGTSPDKLWGYDSLDSSFAMTQYKVDEQGVFLIGKPVEGVLFGFNQDIEFSNGFLYTTNGRVVDPDKQTFDGRFLTSETLTARAFALDVNAGRIYFGQREGFDFNLLEFNLQTYQLTKFYSAYYGLIGDLDSMVRCGSAGLALVVPPPTSRIVIFPLSLLQSVPSYERPQPVPINGGVRRIPLPNYEITYDASRQLFYASVPSVFGGYGNSIVKIDPIAGTVGDPVWVGSEPWQMAVTDDGQYLYTALFGGRAIRRLRLPDLTLDLRFSLFNDGDPFNGPMSTTASEILTVPGHPESLVVARWGDHNHSQFDSDGVAVYDNGIKRPDSTPNHVFSFPSINNIQLSSSGTSVYGMDTDTSDHTFTRMGLDTNGVRITAKQVGIGESISSMMRCQNGLCFTNSGLIIDPEMPTRIDRFRLDLTAQRLSNANLVLPDVPHNRVYFIVALGAGVSPVGGIYVLAFDLNTKKQTASYKLPFNGETIASFWLWGDDQFAFSTGEEIVFFPKSLLQPVTPTPSNQH